MVKECDQLVLYVIFKPSLYWVVPVLLFVSLRHASGRPHRFHAYHQPSRDGHRDSQNNDNSYNPANRFVLAALAAGTDRGITALWNLDESVVRRIMYSGVYFCIHMYIYVICNL